MGKASSSKKIKKVQAAGVSRSPGQRRNLGYPALIVGILLAGTLLTYFARDYRRGEVADAPVADLDHWHAAFAVKLCASFEPNDATPDNKAGIHIHSDKLIHIHPYGEMSAGSNATFGVFAENNGIELGDGTFKVGSRTVTNGEDCEMKKGKKEPGRVALYVWPPQATSKTKPKIVTENIGDVRFAQEGQAFVLAFVPKGTKMELPPSTEALKNPIDKEPIDGAGEDTGSGTTIPPTTPPTTAAEGQTTTSAPATDTTAKPGD